MTTGAKPIQFSLRTLLGTLAAASVVMAIYAATRAVLGTVAVLWLLGNAAYGCLVLYGIYLWRAKDEKWRREFRRYALLGLLDPIYLVFSILMFNAAFAIIGFVSCIIIAYFGLAEVDQQQYRSSKLLWRLYAVVLGKVALFMGAILTVFLIFAILVAWSGF